MDILYFGLILIIGYFLSLVSVKVGFPKIVGYLVAGLILNPGIIDFIPESFVENSEPVTNICLAFITFEIGSSFSVTDLKKTGKKYFKLAFYESFGAFLFIFTVFFFIARYFSLLNVDSFPVIFAFSLILASLAAPTDPSATLAVIHEYKAKGPVTKSILGAAAFDDIVTLILFSLSVSISRSIVGDSDVSFLHLTYSISYRIIGAVLAGFIFGFIFNKTVAIFKVDDKKSLMILFLGFLLVSFGIAKYLEFDELFTTLTLGFVIRNFNKKEVKILDIAEHNLEDFFFLIFFVLSAMHFNFSTIQIKILYLILGFVLIRAVGKYVGMHLGTTVLKMPVEVKKYAFAGLIPQGGIVLGLVLIVGKEPLFQDFENLLVGIIMGATLIHEFLGPLISRATLRKANEIK